MATIKSYTDLEQSKTLNKILPIESADYFHAPDANIVVTEPYITDCGGERCIPAYHGAVPCWSLSALLSVLNKSAYFANENEAGIAELSSIKATKWCVSILNCGKIKNCYADNPIDACYEMIIRLNELNML